MYNTLILYVISNLFWRFDAQEIQQNKTKKKNTLALKVLNGGVPKI